MRFLIIIVMFLCSINSFQASAQGRGAAAALIQSQTVYNPTPAGADLETVYVRAGI